MKLVSINIELDNHLDKVVSFLKKENPDVICMQEVLEENFSFLKNELGLNGILELRDYIDDWYRPKLIGKRQGIAIFSKNIINSGSTFYTGNKRNLRKPFEKYIKEGGRNCNTALLWIETENESGEKFRFVTTHLPVTKHGVVTSYQLKVVKALLNELKKIPNFILCGDTNAPRGRTAFQKIKRKYKDNIPKEYKTSIDQNLHRVKGIQFMVDCLFTTSSYKVSDVRLVDGVSDHMAIVANVEKSKSIMQFAKKIFASRIKSI